MRVAMRGFAAVLGAMAQAARAACPADAPDRRIPTFTRPSFTLLGNGQGNQPLLSGLPVPAPTGIPV